MGAMLVRLTRVAATDDRTESTQGKLERLQQLREEALHPAGEKAVEKQRSQGKLLAHERLESCSTRARSSSSTASCATGIPTSG